MGFPVSQQSLLDGVRTVYPDRFFNGRVGELARAVRAAEIGRDRPDESPKQTAEQV
jgi:hypothetical protein